MSKSHFSYLLCDTATHYNQYPKITPFPQQKSPLPLQISIQKAIPFLSPLPINPPRYPGPHHSPQPPTSLQDTPDSHGLPQLSASSQASRQASPPSATSPCTRPRAHLRGLSNVPAGGHPARTGGRGRARDFPTGKSVAR